KKRFGYFTSCDSLPTTPAVERAVNEAVQALENQGYQAVEFKSAPMINIFCFGSDILEVNSSQEALSKLANEGYRPSIREIVFMGKLPEAVKASIIYILHLFGENLLVYAVNVQIERSAEELWELHHKVETYFVVYKAI
ncbi:hypothetical protein K502DRAFT_347733, partial [Neoconidiobolus thromboides FSU 785]